jgi:hypothetical protein
VSPIADANVTMFSLVQSTSTRPTSTRPRRSAENACDAIYVQWIYTRCKVVKHDKLERRQGLCASGVCLVAVVVIRVRLLAVGVQQVNFTERLGSARASVEDEDRFVRAGIVDVLVGRIIKEEVGERVARQLVGEAGAARGGLVHILDIVVDERRNCVKVRVGIGVAREDERRHLVAVGGAARVGGVGRGAGYGVDAQDGGRHVLVVWSFGCVFYERDEKELCEVRRGANP